MSPSRTPIQAFHLDMKLAQYRPDYLASLFPRLWEAGYDTIVFEIENKVRLDCLGTAAWCEAFTKTEFSAILETCWSVGLRAVPLIQTYAHLEWLLTHAPFHGLREQPGIAYTLCPLKAESLHFLARYLDEVGELFDNPDFIHLGGDEAAYMGSCPACEAVVKNDGQGGLYARHMGWVASRALARGWRPMLWADMVLAHPESLRAFPSEVIWVDWHYEMTPEGPESTYLWGETNRQTASGTSDAFRKTYGAYAFDPTGSHYRPWFYADYLLDQGFDVLIASAASCAGSHSFLPSFDRAANVASASLKLHSEPRLLGQIVTSWAGRLPTLEAQWPLLRLPELLRNQPANWSAALETACHQSFGTLVPGFSEHWKSLGRSFWWAESRHGFDWEAGYVGQPDPIPQMLARRVREGSLNLSEETTQMETLLGEYTRSARELASLLKQADPDNLSTQTWRIGADAIRLRAWEYLLYLRATNGRIEQEQAIEVLQLTESLADRWMALLLRIYQPAGSLLIQAIVYGETRRRLTRMSWGRFEH